MRTPLAIVLLLILLCQATIQAAERQPNVVFFLIDDLGYSDCGFMGGTQIKTPAIDALASGGAILESHYVQPVCSPTRSALMTGRYPIRTGVYTVVRPQAKWGLPLSERTLADALKQAGYTTAIVGKWHLGEFERAYLPTSRGFDHQHGHYFGMIDNYTHLRGQIHDWHHDDQELHEQGYSTHLLTKEACRLIGQHDKTKPLFLYLPYNAVHAPLQVPDSYLAPYEQLKGPRRQLAGMLAAVDEGIGQVVTALEQAGLRENTLIIFSADNGGPPPGRNQPLRGFKGGLYEGGVRGCAFANWPGRIPAGQRITEPMHIIDWYPTLLGLAGIPEDESRVIDGENVWPMLTKQAPSPHEFILCAKSPEQAALRMGDWKLIRHVATSPNDGQGTGSGRRRQARSTSPSWELYNLADDVAETTNLADKESDRLAAMKVRLEQLMSDAVPSAAPLADNE